MDLIQECVCWTKVHKGGHGPLVLVRSQKYRRELLGINDLLDKDIRLKREETSGVTGGWNLEDTLIR